MKKYLLLIALMLFASPAFATYCGSNTDHPGAGKPYYPNNCNDPPTTQPPQPPSQHQTNTQDQHQGQAQGQGQGQGQAQQANGGNAVSSSRSGVDRSGNSRNDVRNSNANTLANSGNSANRNSNRNVNNNAANAQGGNSDATSNANNAVNVDTSDRSVTNVAGSRTNINTNIPGDLPSNAMTIAPGAYITTAGDIGCGVLQTKVQVPVYQWNKKGTKKRQVGFDEDLAPVFDSNGVQIDYQTVYTGNGGYYLRGSHVTYVLSTQGGSNSSQLGLQGGGGGGYGGLSYGSGNSYSQGGAKIIIRSCIASRVEPKPVAKPVVRRKAVKRRTVRPATPPACVERAARVCPAR